MSARPPSPLARAVYGWVLMVYAVFHLWLNILAELLRFGDREFYKARACVHV